MLKKLISIALALILLTSMSIPAFAYNYNFSSGIDHSELLGRPTSTDNLVITDPMTENVRRNKDAAYNPPPLGVSGDIPTEQSSPYHSNTPPNSGNAGGSSVNVSHSPTPNSGSSSGSVLPPASGATGAAASDYGGMLPPTSMNSPDVIQTLPLYYDDGSIGTLHIPKLNLIVKVYSGETLENMRIGVGHFEFTSAWNGNVGISGHNRGVPHAIGGAANLRDGDEIIYTTRYGTRTYLVYDRKQIIDADYSELGWSDLNILTIITCVENTPGMRWSIKALAAG